MQGTAKALIGMIVGTVIMIILSVIYFIITLFIVDFSAGLLLSDGNYQGAVIIAAGIDHTWINARRIIRTAQLNLKTIRKLSVKTLRISFFRFCDELIPFDCVLDAFAEQQFTELFC